MTSPSASASSEGQGAASFCAACGASLAVGARFCHRCGQPVGEPVPVARGIHDGPSAAAIDGARGRAPGAGATPINVAAVLPWGIAFVALLAIVAAFAGRNFGGGEPQGDASSATFPIAPAEGASGAPPATDPATSGAMPGATASGGAAPNIANLTPSERARRLYDRLMRYAANGSADSISFFAPMALASHSMLEAPTLDERYHYGQVAEVTGHPDVAMAQADTILSKRPTSLLGLVLAGRAARVAGNEAAARGFDQRLLKDLSSELARNNPEYQEHRADIDRAVADARRRK